MEWLIGVATNIATWCIDRDKTFQWYALVGATLGC